MTNPTPDTDRRARELLAEEYERDGMPIIASQIRDVRYSPSETVLRAIVRALTEREPVAEPGGDAVEAALDAYMEYAKSIGKQLIGTDHDRRKALSRAIAAADAARGRSYVEWRTPEEYTRNKSAIARTIWVWYREGSYPANWNAHHPLSDNMVAWAEHPAPPPWATQTQSPERPSVLPDANTRETPGVAALAGGNGAVRKGDGFGAGMHTARRATERASPSEFTSHTVDGVPTGVRSIPALATSEKADAPRVPSVADMLGTDPRRIHTDEGRYLPSRRGSRATSEQAEATDFLFSVARMWAAESPKLDRTQLVIAAQTKWDGRRP